MVCHIKKVGKYRSNAKFSALINLSYEPANKYSVYTCLHNIVIN